jgi:GNAT superfamily N-acetyltransferase
MVPTIVRVDSLTGTDALDFTRIFESSFPVDERSPTAEVLRAIAAGDRWTWIARDDGALVGFALLVPLGGTDAVLLEYLAVDPERRSGGVGGRLLDHVCAELRRGAPERTTMLIEIEEPTELSGEARHQADRRLAFYAAKGASVVATPGPYRPPALDAPAERSLAMQLLERPLQPGTPNLDAAALAPCVRAILHQSYGLAVGDPLLTQVVGLLLPGSGGTLAS